MWVIDMGFVDDYIKDLQKIIGSLPKGKIEEIVKLIRNAYKNSKNIFIIGNGGSSSTASHFACDLAKNTIKNFNDKNERRLRVISLTDNQALISAIANDISYDDIFSEQLSNLVNKGDLVIGISASGRSKNVLKAVELASKKGAITIGLIGFDGGKLKDIADHSIIVPVKHYGKAEDAHHIIMHIISYYIKDIKLKE